MLGIKSKYWEKERVERLNTPLFYIGNFTKSHGFCELKEECEERYVLSMKEIFQKEGVEDWENNTLVLDLFGGDVKPISEIHYLFKRKSNKTKSWDRVTIIYDLEGNEIPKVKMSIDGLYDLCNTLEGLLWDEETILLRKDEFYRLGDCYDEFLPDEIKETLPIMKC